MDLKVEYASERWEVWKWYCRAWRRDLWKFHAVVAAVVAFIAMFLLRGDSLVLSLLAALGCGVLSVAWMPMVPLLLFQRELRTVELDQDGISTTIAGDSFRRSWRDIETVSEEDGYIVMQGKKGSAFLVPPRAFQSPDQQQRFLSFALEALGRQLGKHGLEAKRPALPPALYHPLCVVRSRGDIPAQSRDRDVTSRRSCRARWNCRAS